MERVHYRRYSPSQYMRGEKKRRSGKLLNQAIVCAIILGVMLALRMAETPHTAVLRTHVRNALSNPADMSRLHAFLSLEEIPAGRPIFVETPLRIDEDILLEFSAPKGIEEEIIFTEEIISEEIFPEEIIFPEEDFFFGAGMD